MRTELPVISFLSMGLLVVLSPVFIRTRNVPVISLAAWLICCNLVHGVNTLLWAVNSTVHVPVWCDIVTRILLAAQLALPGCVFALTRNLRRCAIGQEVAQRAYTYMQDLTFCLIIPVFYVILHVIVQSHRFDIAEDFGCFASIHTSTVSIILIWIPPLVICIGTFIYAFLAIRGRLDSGLVFFSHMQDSPTLNILAFLRPLLTAILIALVSLSTTIFAMYARVNAIGGLKTWSVDSWSGVHAHMTEVFVILPVPRIDLVRVEVEWWVIPACSFVLIFITLSGLAFPASGDCSQSFRSLSHWFRHTVLRRSLPEPRARPSKSFRSQILSTASWPTLVGDRKSFHDDVWRPSSPAKVKLARLDIPDTPQSTASSCVSSEHDDAFVQSTLNYIESPTGREALGFPPFPPALHSPPRRQVGPSSPPPLTQSASTSPRKEDQPAIVAPRPNSILAAPWPRPPSTLPTSPRTPSPKANAAIHVQPPSPGPAFPFQSPRPPSITSLTTSLASSTVSMSAYQSILEDFEPHAVPFQDHLSDAHLGAGPGLAVPKHARKMRSRDVLLPRSLSASSRRRHGSDGLSGGIYMTVVKETV